MRGYNFLIITFVIAIYVRCVITLLHHLQLCYFIFLTLSTTANCSNLSSLGGSLRRGSLRGKDGESRLAQADNELSIYLSRTRDVAQGVDVNT